jgi:hypothetical protein
VKEKSRLTVADDVVRNAAVSEALLQRREPLVFRAARPSRNLALGFETIPQF